jgi:NAD(P)-dependent dehydrogenase (short-subunit alcohol dehydrogenase family)
LIAITTANGKTHHGSHSNLRRQGAVLITGASSGIGYATAVRLARHGTIVFAGIRRQIDGELLLREGAGNIKPMLIDVADHHSLFRARAKIESLREYRLDALVNNAGIAIAGPLELLPIDQMRKQFEVNFFGAMAAIQTFLPLLREAGGRIVNVSSISGKLASPFIGAYAASKFALEAASDALRLELRPFGVSVSVVEPGSVRTPMWRRSTEASLKILDEVSAGRSDYDAGIRQMMRLAQRLELRGLPPERIARVIEEALIARRPRARYLVGGDARLRLVVARLPESLRDWLITLALGGAPERADIPIDSRF